MTAAVSPRWLQRKLREALDDTPVVLLNGARQTGKSTLARQLPGRYLTLDDSAVLAAARNDPDAFVGQHKGLLVIDEVHKAPQLFAAIKAAVDRDRQPGRFLLTGSADVRMLPQAAESLAGRLEVLSLQPFAQGELERVQPALLSRLFANAPGEPSLPAAGPDLAARLCRGGFPEACSRSRPSRRLAWFDAYVLTITQRDVRDLANIADLTALPRLLQLLALRSGTLANTAELSRSSAVPAATLQRYLALLQATFLYQPLPAWHGHPAKRLIKAPKSHLIDSGLACALVGVDEGNWQGSSLRGALLESFVCNELRRLVSAEESPLMLYHYRSAGGSEVDFVLEARDGRCVGIECKAGSSPGERHFRGLQDLRTALGERFACGVVLYSGQHLLPFGDRLWALPISALWSPI